MSGGDCRRERKDEDRLTPAIVSIAGEFGRYGYRRITALLQREDRHVGIDRVKRTWCREGLNVQQKLEPQGRLWRNNGSCAGLRPERRNHVWSCACTTTQSGRAHRQVPSTGKPE